MKSSVRERENIYFIDKNQIKSHLEALNREDEKGDTRLLDF